LRRLIILKLQMDFIKSKEILVVQLAELL
jgi:hypothetical protein